MRREFEVVLAGHDAKRPRRSDLITVTIRHRVHHETESHDGLKAHIASVYRMLWRSWPPEYIDTKNHLILPPADVLFEHARHSGTVDNDIQGAIEAWCQNYPNTDDSRVNEIARKVRGEPYVMDASDMHYLCGKFLEAHNLGD